MRLLPLDELNVLSDTLQSLSQADTRTERYLVDKLLDDALDFFLIAYFNGSQDAAEMLGISDEPNISKARDAINKKIAGKDYKDRLREYAGTGNTEAIIRVLDTDMTRVYNAGVLDTAKGKAKTKTWNTMQDPRVRETHEPLEGVTIPIDADFYTFDGDKAQAPGNFAKAENNVNCRCYITVS